MYPALIAMTAAALIFCVASMACGLVRKPRTDIEGRLLSLQYDRGEIPPKAEPRPRRRRWKSSPRLEKQRKKLEKVLGKMENELYDVGIRMPVYQFFLLWIGITVLLPLLLLLLGVNSIISMAVAMVCGLGPAVYLKLRRSKRRNQLENQLVEAISVLCNALKAGHSFQTAMNNISQEMSGPVAEEFSRVFRETQHGMTLAESMERMNERVGSGDLEMMCTAVLIQREVGGNLAEVLENISETIRRRLALKAEVKTRTASGRMSGYIIGAIPILLLAVMVVTNPDYSMALFYTKLGNMMLAFSGLMEVVGFLVIQKIVNIKY